MSTLPADNLNALLDSRIFQPLVRLRRRCRLHLVIDGAVRLYIVMMATSVAQALLDWWLRLGIDQRGLFDALLTAVWAIVLYRRVIRALLCRISDQSLALAVDRAHPGLHDTIGSAVQFARGGAGDPDSNSPTLIRSVLEDASRVAPGIAFGAVLDSRRASRRFVELVILLSVTLIAFAAIPGLMGAWFQRNWLLRETPWPQNTYITPVGFDTDGRRRMPRGEEATLEAINRGHVPKSVTIRWRTTAGESGRGPMTQIGDDRWTAQLGAVSEDIRFEIVGGDEHTREYTIVAADRPRVVGSAARVSPPEYTRLDPIELEGETVIDLPAGSSLEIDAMLNTPVQTARFISEGGAEAPCTLASPTHARVVWDRPSAGAYAFVLADRDGWTNQRPVRFTIRVVPDKAPETACELPDVGESITPVAEAPVVVTISDDYGLTEARLLAQRGDSPPYEIALDGFEGGTRDFVGGASLSAADLGAQVGDKLRIWVEARDGDPLGPNLARSRATELRVVSSPDLLAELAARELELRRDFERLISAQRGVGDATARILPELPLGASTPAPLAQRLAGLARRQEAHARSCLAVKDRFERILGEMRVNKVARAGDERRIGGRIVTPLGRLAHEAMPEIVAMLSSLRNAATGGVIEALPAQHAELLTQMQAVLSNMLEWEGYREAIELLQEIIDAQADVRAATIESLQRQLDEILELDEPQEPAADDGLNP